MGEGVSSVSTSGPYGAVEGADQDPNLGGENMRGGTLGTVITILVVIILVIVVLRLI